MCEGKVNGKSLLSEKEKVINVGKVWRVVGLLGEKKKPAFWSFQVSEAEMNGQFESVCESVFSEVESQAMEALDLPGCFRTRSHSYLRAIQAGYSQDDECVPSMSSSTVTSTIRSTAGESPGRLVRFITKSLEAS